MVEYSVLRERPLVQLGDPAPVWGVSPKSRGGPRLGYARERVLLGTELIESGVSLRVPCTLYYGEFPDCLPQILAMYTGKNISRESGYGLANSNVM